jgi:D-glycero-alpha-D-manno-heptose 1-phosphate guanylyltransferase
MTASAEQIVPLILAGGRGTRIAELFPNLPKPAIPVGGRPFLGWILGQLSRAGFRQVVVSGGYLIEVLKEQVLPHVPPGLRALWIDEKRPLGTGGGAIHAAGESGLHPQHWLVMNGDSFLGGDWLNVVLENQKGSALIVARRVEECARFGRLRASDGRLVSFMEKAAMGPGLINAGIYLLPYSWLATGVSPRSRSMEKDLIPLWLKSGKFIKVLEAQGPFLDIGIAEDYHKADDFFAACAGVS